MDAIYFDYDKQVWVVADRYMDCNHPKSMNCGCYGRLHANERVEDIKSNES